MEDLKRVLSFGFFVLLGVVAKMALQERKLEGAAFLRLLVLGGAAAFIVEGTVLVFLHLPEPTHSSLVVVAALTGGEILEGLYAKVRRDGFRSVLSQINPKREVPHDEGGA